MVVAITQLICSAGRHHLISSYRPGLENRTVLDPYPPLVLQDLSIVGPQSSQSFRISKRFGKVLHQP